MHRSLRVGPEDREGRILVNRVTRLDVLQDVTHPTPGPEPPDRLERGMRVSVSTASCGWPAVPGHPGWP